MEPVTKEQLLAVNDIRDRIKHGDSFEGFLNYLLPEPSDPSEIVARLEARYRIGNSEGQGGMRMIGVRMGGSS